MQLIAHSVIPSNPVPYMHLGYISAQGQVITFMSPADKMLLFASITVIIGVSMIVTIFLRRSLVVLLIGIILLMCGVTGLIFSRELPKTRPVAIPLSPGRSIQP